jgi:membrane associated rhomboid family serine protease
MFRRKVPPPMDVASPRQPILNVPPVMVATLAALGLVHAFRALLSEQADLDFLLLFAFIPARYDATLIALPGGLAAEIWTFVSYALIHGDVTHLGFNAVWLLAFGTPLARRFGPLRFFAFCAVTAIVGALAHLFTHAGQLQPMVGASATISGAMAAAMRFVFQPGGPLRWGATDDAAYRIPALPLSVVLRDPRVLAFLGVWFGLNLLFGLGTLSITGGDQPIAWQAHFGGFAAGLLLFSWFDPVPRNQTPATLH